MNEVQRDVVLGTRTAHEYISHAFVGLNGIESALRNSWRVNRFRLIRFRCDAQHLFAHLRNAPILI